MSYPRPDPEVGAVKKSDEQPPKDGEKSPTSIKARFGYVAINTGILLVITTALSPLLVFIALPNLFIITGQRPRMEEYFWQAFWFGTALTDTIFFIYLRRQYRRGGTFREASTSTLGGLALTSLVLIFMSFMIRLCWPIVYIAWVGLNMAVLWLWGGADIVGGYCTSWDDLRDAFSDIGFK